MLPAFPYHPDPIATGNIKSSDQTCRCCEQSRGYIYTGPVYSEQKTDEAICPFCIADGTAAKKFSAIFSDDHPLTSAGVPLPIVDEVTRRTPGYTSWQQDAWLACCGDACEFHGDAPREELRALDEDAVEEILSEVDWSATEWSDFVDEYAPGGDPAAYKFICRHCRRSRYGIDFT